MIRAICLNPVIDRSYHVNGFEPGKKYFHLLREVSIGGKGINVAKVCKQCGEPVTLYGFIAGSNGKMIRAYMEKEGIDACLIEINGNTRETINIIDLEQGRESELVEQGPTVEVRQVEQLLCRLREDLQRDDIVICSGMTIEGAPADLYSEISAMCRWKEARCFLDTNSVTVEQLRKDGYYFYKPNLQELFELFGREPVSDRTAVRKLALQLVQDGVAYVLVSLGSEGGILAGREGCWEAVIPSVQVTSTIGSGDSTVAGFAIGLRKSWSMEEIFRFSMACGIANAMEKQVGRVDPERLEMIKNEIRIKNIPNKEVSYL